MVDGEMRPSILSVLVKSWNGVMKKKILPTKKSGEKIN